MARDEGWLAEHMLIVKVTSPGGPRLPHRGGVPVGVRQDEPRDAAADPSRAGRSRRSATTSPGCARARTGGCARSTPRPASSASRPAPARARTRTAVDTLWGNTIFTNVALRDDGDVWWEGLTDEPPAHLIDWQRRGLDARQRPPGGASELPLHGRGRPVPGDRRRLGCVRRRADRRHPVRRPPRDERAARGRRRATGGTASSSAPPSRPRRRRPPRGPSASSAATRSRCCRSAATTWPTTGRTGSRMGEKLGDERPRDLPGQLVPQGRRRPVPLARVQRERAGDRVDRPPRRGDRRCRRVADRPPPDRRRTRPRRPRPPGRRRGCALRRRPASLARRVRPHRRVLRPLRRPVSRPRSGPSSPRSAPLQAERRSRAPAALDRRGQTRSWCLRQVPVERGGLDELRVGAGVRSRGRGRAPRSGPQSTTVDRRCAITMSVRSTATASIASRISCSLRPSRLDVDSSSSSTGGAASSARAIARRWRSPPESMMPSSPTGAPSPSVVALEHLGQVDRVQDVDALRIRRIRRARASGCRGASRRAPAHPARRSRSGCAARRGRATGCRCPPKRTSPPSAS